jgi:hypothetical protein
MNRADRCQLSLHCASSTQLRTRASRCPSRVTNGLDKYLTRRMVLANLGEVCFHGDESGCGGSAAQFCSKLVFRVSTRPCLFDRSDFGRARGWRNSSRPPRF